MTLTRTYGLIGYPVSHSLSPLMHNAAFKALGIDAEYKLFPLKEDELETFLKSFKANNIHGINVTVPYKEKVIPFLNKISHEAQLIGAVNTIKLTPEGLEGFNTDGAGFLTHLEDFEFDVEGKNIVILGAGGASRAVGVYLAKTKPRKITIFDIDKIKLGALVNHLKDNFKNVEILESESIEGLDIKNCDLLINATPIGMKDSDPVIVDFGSLHKKMFVYDLIYNPSETKLLKLAKENGAKTANGLGMLLHQGILAFEIWTAQEAPVEIMRNALLGGLK